MTAIIKSRCTAQTDKEPSIFKMMITAKGALATGAESMRRNVDMPTAKPDLYRNKAANDHLSSGARPVPGHDR